MPLTWPATGTRRWRSCAAYSPVFCDACFVHVGRQLAADGDHQGTGNLRPGHLLSRRSPSLAGEAGYIMAWNSARESPIASRSQPRRWFNGSLREDNYSGPAQRSSTFRRRHTYVKIVGVVGGNQDLASFRSEHRRRHRAVHHSVVLSGNTGRNRCVASSIACCHFFTPSVTRLIQKDL